MAIPTLWKQIREGFSKSLKAPTSKVGANSHIFSMVLIIDFKVVTSGINLNLNHSTMKPYLAPIFHKLFLLLLFCTFGMLISCSEDEDDLVLTETVSLKFTSP